MTGFWDQVQTFFWNIIHRPTWIDYLDIVIIAFLIYQLVTITRQTRAIQVLKGLAIIIVASYVSELMGLTTLNWVLRSILNNGVIALMILFQPELRKALIEKAKERGEESEIMQIIGDPPEKLHDRWRRYRQEDERRKNNYKNNPIKKKKKRR